MANFEVGHVVAILDIPEILDDVVKYLDKRTLARATRVCKSLHNAAIRWLWSGLILLNTAEKIDERANMLEHLRTLLPSDLSAPVAPTSPGMWDRFRHYSSHLKGTVINDEHIWPGFFSTFKDQQAEFFPRLQRIAITWQAVNLEGLSWMFLIGSSLISLRIYYWQDSQESSARLQALELILRRLPIQAPDLEELEIDDPSESAKSKESTTSFHALQSLPALQRFSWGSYIPLAQDTVLLLSTLPRLAQLQIPGGTILGEPGAATDSRFPALQSLQLRHLKTKPDSWLKNISNPHLLTRLSLDSFRISSSSFRSFNLTHIEINICHQISWDNLAPLLSCKAVKECQIVVTDGLPGFGDHELGVLVSSWRDLEAFSFEEIGGVVHTTILGLASLATSCLKLRKLHLTVRKGLRQRYGDSWQDEYRRIRDASYPSSSLLKEICLKLEPTTQPVEFTRAGLGTLGIATLLRRLWPSFDPSGLRHEDYDDPEPWEEVEAPMRLMMLMDRENQELRTKVSELESELLALRQKYDLLQKGVSENSE